ncbi:Pex19 protein family-domain-containing protein [Gloeopeniophorella convolvens]|nr:Pex19 protein family-domain-containing protein [Gloeopeniophorella convolvens]
MATPTTKAQEKRPAVVDDDSDVDDLDDVIDDFAKQPPVKSPQPPPSRPPAGAAAPPPSATSPGVSDAAFDTDFAQEFARQMESMLRELATPESASNVASGSGATAAEGDDTERDKAFRAAWEAMLVEGMDGALGGLSEGKDVADTSEDAFQKNVREAMERLHKSDANLQADASAPPADDLAALLSSLGGGPDGVDDDALQGLLEGMMGQLMGKDVLYEPLKELNDKFPSYLESNADKLSASDLERYRAQFASASKIVAAFEDPAFKEDDPQKAAEIVALMSEMQEHGAPPAEIMGPLPPGLELGPDGAPKLPDGCVVA